MCKRGNTFSHLMIVKRFTFQPSFDEATVDTQPECLFHFLILIWHQNLWSKLLFMLGGLKTVMIPKVNHWIIKDCEILMRTYRPLDHHFWDFVGPIFAIQIVSPIQKVISSYGSQPQMVEFKFIIRLQLRR